MTFQARRQSCPVTNRLMELLPQQRNYNKPFARKHKEPSRPCSSSLNFHSSTTPFQCKEPHRRAERPQPGTGDLNHWSNANWYRVSISYRTRMRLPLCPMSAPRKTDLELLEKCPRLHAGKEQVGGTVLIHLHTRNKHRVPRLQPSLVWGTLSSGLQTGNAPGL